MNKPTPLEREYIAVIVAARHGVLGNRDSRELKPVWAPDYRAISFPYFTGLWFPVTRDDWERAKHEAICAVANWPTHSALRN